METTNCPVCGREVNITTVTYIDRVEKQLTAHGTPDSPSCDASLVTEQEAMEL